MTLDGAKSGMSVKKSQFEEDRQKFGINRPPAWKETDAEAEANSKGVAIHPKRPSKLGKFIMDGICDEIKRIEEEWLQKVNDLASSLGNQGVNDPALTAPYLEALEKASSGGRGSELYAEDLEKIRKHVNEIYEDYKLLIRNGPLQQSAHSSPTKKSPSKKSTRQDSGAIFTTLKIEDRQDGLRRLSLKFWKSPPKNEMFMMHDQFQRVKASYAYLLDWETRRQKQGTPWSRFPWDVAFRQLCAMKAGPDSKSVSSYFYNHMAIRTIRNT